MQEIQKSRSSNYPVAVITGKGEKLLKGGHVWVYADEVISLDAVPENGDIVAIRTTKNKFMGLGFFNANSKIRIRMITRSANDIPNETFWARRVGYALAYRYSVMGETDFKCCRLIFGEADSFPGLTVDRFENILVAEVLSMGMEKILDWVFPALVTQLKETYGAEIDAVYLRNDMAIRTLEGLPRFEGYYTHPSLSLKTDADGLDGTTKITENGIIYTVDYVNGQKTGFFLDQKYNRRAIHAVSKGRRVLDCFTHTGSFGLNAAIAGADHVTSVDISEDALKTAAENAAQNGLSNKITYVKADVFDYLRTLATGRGAAPYDFIILDPPAFTKSRDTLKNAIKGYREINVLAMKLLPRGGYLATCSCSHFMTDTYFKQMLHNAAEDAGVSLRQIEARQQGPDHPILWNVPETDYLTFYIFQVV
ncbi:MAG: class I SAM-dependent rRNA methyltransferase [Clostridia bacterium]|nr:class I SAM-dependent rRNA methyltransferase [Clostridia bacterium]